MSVLPDWNSLESTARWSGALFWAGMIALVVLAATQVASRMLASRSNFLAQERFHATSAPIAVSTGRHLTEAQKQVLETALTPFAGQQISFACNAGDLEADAYVREFRTLLAKAGWKIVGADNVQAVVVPAPVGINLYVNKEELELHRAPAAAVALAQTLIQLHIVKGGVIGSMNKPDIPPDLIGFFAGSAN